jgi:hypothetical protein
MKQAVAEGLLYLIPEPKSPHGVDVTPDGKYLTISGKLDSHTWVYSWAKIKAAIDNKKFEGEDPYGVPIIAINDVLHKSVNVGLGPLHTQYDSKECVAYTSIYVDSMITKWDYCEGKVLHQLPVHYNVGHLMTMEGDSVTPDGKYLVSLNKLAIDRFWANRTTRSRSPPTSSSRACATSRAGTAARTNARRGRPAPAAKRPSAAATPTASVRCMFTAPPFVRISRLKSSRWKRAIRSLFT